MKVYRVSVSDDKVKFFKQLLDNLNIDYSTDDVKKKAKVEAKVKVTKAVLKPKVKPENKELNLLDKQKSTDDRQKSLQEVIKNLEKLRS